MLGTKLATYCIVSYRIEIVVFERGWVTLSADCMDIGGRPPTTVGVRKLESLGYHVAFFA